MLSLRAKPFLIILVSAIVLTALTGSLTMWIRSIYSQNYPLGALDPVSYSFYNARLYTRLAYEDRFAIAMEEWQSNPRHPLRTIPLLLLAPNLLAHRMGHMATTLPMLLSCVFLLGWTIYARMKHMLYALAGMALFCAIPGMYWGDGLAIYWLDLSAAFLVGSSVFCIVNSDGGRNLRWLSAFAFFASLAALSRYVAAGYTFLICGPLLAYYLARRWWRERNITQALLQPIALVGAIIGVLAGYFIVAHFQHNMGFYSTYGYAIWQDSTIVESLESVISGLVHFVPWRMLGVFGIILVVNLILLLINHTWDWENVMVSAWWAVSLLLGLSVILRTEGDRHAILSAVPLITFVSLSPAPLQSPRDNKWRTLLSGIIASIALGLITLSVWESYRVAVNPSTEIRQQKSFDIALATELQQEGHPLVWNVYFDEYSWIPAMEAFYQSGNLHLPAGQPFFNAHLTAWHGDYPGLTPEEVSKRIYIASVKWVDMAVVFADPAQAYEAEWLNNDYSRAVAAYMSSQLSQDAAWQEAFKLDGPYGQVVGYRNVQTNGDAYESVLYNNGQIRP